MLSRNGNTEMQFWCHTWCHTVTSWRYLMSDTLESCLIKLPNLKIHEIWRQDQCFMTSGSQDNDMQLWCHTWCHAVTLRRYLMSDTLESCLVELSNLKNPEIDTKINVLWHLRVEIMICNFDVTHDVMPWHHINILILAHLKVV